ncbi:MAG TPA: class I SAM-dependent methyltransferase [Sedimentisphaerales bacterium]|nr:class I SAM-dependent methyltransferase [Sedimentisphaerales bacterium]
MIKELRLFGGMLGKVHEGQNCYIAHNESLASALQTRYARPNLCLKIFRKMTEDELLEPEQFKWAGNRLIEATKIQNLFALAGLAPRVYGLVLLNGERLAQVTDYVTGEGTPDKKGAARMAGTWDITAYELEKSEQDIAHYLARDSKWVGDKLVDFGRLRFANPRLYRVWVKRHVELYHKKPREERIGYQPCPELGVGGKRDVKARAKQMKMSEVDFVGATVLDIGCNQGAFMRLADDMGAARVIGIDHKHREGNYLLANWLGYWNLDFYQLELPSQWKQIREKSGIRTFDIAFCLSIVGHAGGYASWIPRLCGGLMWFSGQSTEKREKYQAELARDFSTVQWLGYVTDHGAHPMWLCWK